MDNSSKYKRKTYFIEKSFQAKFILKFCGLVVFGGLLTLGWLYFLATQSTTVSIVNSRVVVRSTADFLLPALLQTFITVTIVIGLVTIFMTLFFSHKIAGPLYRFKKTMRQLEGGDFSGDFKIRRPDQLQDIAAALGDMVYRIREELASLKENCRLLKDKLDGISDEEVAEYKREYFKELKKISQDINKTIQHFKT